MIETLSPGLSYWRAGSLTAPTVLWSIGGAIFLVYYAVVPMRRLLYLGWMHAIYPIGWTVSHLVLAIVYFLVLTPIGVCMRLLGRDPMQRRLDPSAGTYWIPHDPPGDSARYFRQF